MRESFNAFLAFGRRSENSIAPYMRETFKAVLAFTRSSEYQPARKALDSNRSLWPLKQALASLVAHAQWEQLHPAEAATAEGALKALGCLWPVIHEAFELWLRPGSEEHKVFSPLWRIPAVPLVDNQSAPQRPHVTMRYVLVIEEGGQPQSYEVVAQDSRTLRVTLCSKRGQEQHATSQDLVWDLTGATLEDQFKGLLKADQAIFEALRLLRSVDAREAQAEAARAAQIAQELLQLRKFTDEERRILWQHIDVLAALLQRG